MSLANFVPPPKFEDYRKRSRILQDVRRDDGVIVVEAHTKGGPN